MLHAAVTADGVRAAGFAVSVPGTERDQAAARAARVPVFRSQFPASCRPLPGSNRPAPDSQDRPIDNGLDLVLCADYCEGSAV